MTRGLLVVPVLLVSFAMPVFPQGKEAGKDKDQAFKQGLDAREKKNNWAQVANFMRQAIAARGTESPEKVKGKISVLTGGLLGGGVEYTPHYFLGEALSQQGDCAGAMDEWWISE